MREFYTRKQGVWRGPRPNLLILNEGTITSLSLFKPLSSNRDTDMSVRYPFCTISHDTSARGKNKHKKLCGTIAQSFGTAKKF